MVYPFGVAIAGSTDVDEEFAQVSLSADVGGEC